MIIGHTLLGLVVLLRCTCTPPFWYRYTPPRNITTRQHPAEPQVCGTAKSNNSAWTRGLNQKLFSGGNGVREGATATWVDPQKHQPFLLLSPKIQRGALHCYCYYASSTLDNNGQTLDKPLIPLFGRFGVNTMLDWRRRLFGDNGLCILGSPFSVPHS